MKQTHLQVNSDLMCLWWDCGCDTGFLIRLWVWHSICDETVGVTQDLWWDCGCDKGFVMMLWVWHRICDEMVGVTQDLWWDGGCDTGFVMTLWVWHRICDETVGVTQDLWWDCGCYTGFVMRLWVWHRICGETVGVTQDSVSIKDLSECQLFSSVCMLTVNCEESDCSLVNCHIVCFFGTWDSEVVKTLHY